MNVGILRASLRAQLFKHPGRILVPLFLVAMISIFGSLRENQSSLQEQSAIQHAKQLTEMLTTFRTLYTSEVVTPALKHGIEVTHDYKNKPGAIPLPATLSMMIGHDEKDDVGDPMHQNLVGTHLYSKYPFPWRSNGGLSTSFKKRAWEALNKKPDQAFYEFVTHDDGNTILLYATSDLMREGCVACHNSHADSPKTDWKLGDVRGVLEVVIPLNMFGFDDSNLSTMSLTMLFIAVIGIFIIGYILKNLRSESDDHKTAKLSLEVANDTLEQRVEERTNELFLEKIYLKSTLETVKDGIIVIDKEGIIQTFNPTAEEIFGWTEEEVVGKDVKILMPAQFAHNHSNHVKDFQKGDNLSVVDSRRDLEGMRKDGTKFPMDLAIKKMVIDNRVLFTGVIRDTTLPTIQKQELIDALEYVEENQRTVEEQNEELMNLAGEYEEACNIANAANKTKSSFLANMSHELRTPLNAIIGFSEMMLKNIGGDPSEKHQEYLNDILSSGKHLVTVINDILDLSKIEAGKTDIHPESINVSSVFETCLTIISERAKDKKIGIDFCGPCKGKYDVYADPDRLKQVVLNLLSNAVKFTDNGGAIEIRCWEEGERIGITIKDTGIGMDELGLAAALEKFGQVDDGLNRIHSGTGLGLPLSVELMKLMNGTLLIESEPNVGTVVTLLLPKEEVTL